MEVYLLTKNILDSDNFVAKMEYPSCLGIKSTRAGTGVTGDDSRISCEPRFPDFTPHTLADF
jgi:hypothetical protein